MLNNAALIVAGGNGSRFGDDIPKQYYKLENGRSILQETILAFKTHKMVDLVCVVLCEKYQSEVNCLKTYSGKTRQESVRNGLRFLKKYQPKKVLIHDGVRPFVSKNLISEVISKLQNYEAVDIGLPIVDTIKTYDGVIVPRENLYASQTPQGFHFDVISSLHERTTKHYTDDISLYLANDGKKLCVIPGEAQNIKITYKEDLLRYR